MTGWTPSAYSYTVGVPPQPSHRLSTSPTELRHLALAYVVLTVDLTIIFSRSSGVVVTAVPGIGALLLYGGIAAVTALTGFVAHEMAHKVVAQRQGHWAEFRMSPFGLVLSLLTAFIGFLFAAPGATVIGGMADAREWGRTSLAGPATNLVEGAAFLGVGLALDPGLASIIPYSLAFVGFINGLFAAFNLIPFGPLDGRKVLSWSAAVWGGMFALAIVFTIGAYLLTQVA